MTTSGHADGTAGNTRTMPPQLWQTKVDFVADAGLRAVLRTLGPHAGAPDAPTGDA